MSNFFVDRAIVPRSLDGERVPLRRTKVGDTAPLLKEPLVVTHGDLMSYVNTIDDLATCLDKDARANLIFQNPAQLRVEAQTLANNAALMDGCTETNPNLCPRADQAPLPKDTVEWTKRKGADELRAQSRLKGIAAEAMEKRAADRGLKNDAAGNAQVLQELAFYQDLSAYRTALSALYTKTSSTTIAGSSDWKAIQAADVEYQTLRSRYIALGFAPSCALPDLSKLGIPWVKIAVIGTIGAVAYLGVQYYFLRRAVPSAAA